MNATDADNMGTLLIGAASACSSELVELLLAHGADLGATDRWGCTALAAACSGGGTASVVVVGRRRAARSSSLVARVLRRRRRARDRQPFGGDACAEQRGPNGLK